MKQHISLPSAPAARLTVCCCICFCCLRAANADAEKINGGKVISVSDGDTITVLSGHRRVRIRLHGVDSPERRQPYGRQTRKFTSEMVLGEKVKLRILVFDRLGQAIARVYIRQKCLNDELLRAGMSWHNRQVYRNRRLAALEHGAQKARRGLWAAPNPTPPWVWRRRHGRYMRRTARESSTTAKTARRTGVWRTGSAPRVRPAPAPPQAWSQQSRKVRRPPAVRPPPAVVPFPKETAREQRVAEPPAGPTRGTGPSWAETDLKRRRRPPWTRMSSGTTDYMWSIWGSGPDSVFMVGYSGAVLRHDGATWTRVSTKTSQALMGVWGSGPDDVFAVGLGGTILRYDGARWTRMPSGTGMLLYGVWGSGPDDVFAVGLGGTIVHYDGARWTRMTSGTTRFLWSVWGSGPGDVYAVGEGGIILHYDGLRWARMPYHGSDTLHGVWGSGPRDVYAVGQRGTILHYDGTVWTRLSFFDTKTLHGVWGTGPRDVYAVGEQGTILHYDGFTWTNMDFFSTRSLYTVWGNGTNDLFAGGSGGLIIHHDCTPPGGFPGARRAGAR